MHIGPSPHDNTCADVADHTSCEDGAVDDRQDHGLDWRSHSQAEMSLEVRRKVKNRGRVKRRRHVVDVRDRRHRCGSSQVHYQKFVLVSVVGGEQLRFVVRQQWATRLNHGRSRPI